ncbi:MAG: hypothetical protein MO847_00780 [Candidatus Protistobacter heckmanni]|nr:hypothetical protein [Candidatus Protistobacter heckmanni]
MRLSKMFICAALPAAGPAATAQAMEQNVYATVGGTLAIGPRTLSINNAAFGNSGSTANGGDALFDLANDGRFKYMGTLGVAYRNFGLEAKYINLGSQHLTGVNGSGLTKDENGYFSGKYYGLNAVAFIPMNEGRQDFYFMIGGGRLKTHFSTTATQGFHRPGRKGGLAVRGGPAPGRRRALQPHEMGRHRSAVDPPHARQPRHFPQRHLQQRLQHVRHGLDGRVLSPGPRRISDQPAGERRYSPGRTPVHFLNAR